MGGERPVETAFKNCEYSFLQPCHHRDDHGAALGVFEQIAADGSLHRALQLAVIPAPAAVEIQTACLENIFSSGRCTIQRQP